MLQGTLIDELIETVKCAEEHVHTMGTEHRSEILLAYEAPQNEALAGVA